MVASRSARTRAARWPAANVCSPLTLNTRRRCRSHRVRLRRRCYAHAREMQWCSCGEWLPPVRVPNNARHAQQVAAVFDGYDGAMCPHRRRRRPPAIMSTAAHRGEDLSDRPPPHPPTPWKKPGYNTVVSRVVDIHICRRRRILSAGGLFTFLFIMRAIWRGIYWDPTVEDSSVNIRGNGGW